MFEIACYKVGMFFVLRRITKSKQRGSDRKRVSHHICGVKALANTSVYWLQALPCICSDLPACDCYAP